MYLKRLFWRHNRAKMARFCYRLKTVNLVKGCDATLRGAYPTLRKMVLQMERRTFLKGMGAAGLASMALQHAKPAQAAEPWKIAGKLRGVNLGGWLALEKWISPEVYAGVQADDEYTLCQTLGKDKATARLKQHRETWVTADDFKWIASHGLNSVRLPIGYGILEENPPFIQGVETLDWAFHTARANNLGVILDLHGVPGSQNGMDHSGRQGALGWHTSPENIAHSLRIVDNLAAHCKDFDNLVGFEVLNEPRWDVPMTILKTFYQDAYQRVRKHIRKEQAAVVIHDGFRPMEWEGFMHEPEYANVILDTHLYQCYTAEDKKRDIHAQVEIAALERKRQLDKMQQQLWGIVGEWSCALDPQSLQGLKGFSLDAAMRAYGDAQLISYETTHGWFYWTYKRDGGGAWSFRDCVQRGWLPEKYA